MPASIIQTPDVVVLGGGGILGEAWMTGLLAGLRDAGGVDVRDARAFVGTSAGSIVSASLAAGRTPRRPGGRDRGGRTPGDAGDRDRGPAARSDDRPRAPNALTRASGALGALTAPVGLALHAPLGARARALGLARVPEGGRTFDDLRASVDAWGVSFDGRLRVCAVDRGSGKRVVFGSQGAPDAPVSAAVAASCSIPGVFAPVRIGGRDYVDGGAWSPVNLDAAPAGRGDHVLVLEPTAVLLRGVLKAAARVEALSLRRRGAEVTLVAPDAEAAPLMPRLMDPDRGGKVLAAGYQQGLALCA